MIILEKNKDHFSFRTGKSFIPIEESLIPYLSDNIEIEDGVTFGQFFDIILKHHEEYSEFFISYLGGVPLSDFIGEWNSKPKETYPKMEYINIQWGKQYIFIDEINDINIPSIPEFVGIENNDKSTDELLYSLEFTPLNKLKHCKLKLIYENDIFDVKTGKIICSLNRGLSVFDVLVSVFNEITYSGNPEERAKTLDMLKDRLKKSIEQSERGKSKSISLDKFLKDNKIDPPKE